MKKNICKIILFAMVFVIVLAICIYADSDKHKSMKDSGADGVLKKQENVVADEKKAQNENNTVEGNNEEMELTKEYVCSEFGIDEAEFEGVDFEDFVDYYNLSYDTIHKEAVAYLLKRYKEDYGKVRIPDYDELFINSSQILLTEENKNDIAIVIFEKSIDDETEAYIFDFEIGKIIITDCPGIILEDEIVGIADDEVKNGIINLFDLYNVYSWRVERRKKIDINIMDDGYANWTLEIMFNSAESYRLSGNGINDEYAPEDLDLFVEDLKALATSAGNQN